jgi:hypothetical protein
MSIIGVNNQAKTLCIFRLYRSFDPPKSPLKRGTLSVPVPPFLRGARGDLWAYSQTADQ